MKNTAVIYDPYLDTLGGGERYALTVAQSLQNLGWVVKVAWPKPDTLAQAQVRFNLDLSKTTIDTNVYQTLSHKSNLFKRWRVLSPFELVFVVSDGSVPILFGNKKLLHYQVPFTHVNQNRLVNQVKLSTITHIVVNSYFTKKIIDQTLGTQKSIVLYPPVDVEAFDPQVSKKNWILNVGRFASPSHSKRQDVLIEAFTKLLDQGLSGWKLVLAGGQKGQDTVLESLKAKAHDLPVEFVVNPDFETLRTYYNRSAIYWHAAGFEVDEALNPEAVEHFGMTTVEAMAAGCVPVVIAKGGQKEIVTPESGFLEQNLEGLVTSTQKLIADKTLWQEKATEAVARAQDFGLKKFVDNFKTLLNE